MFKIKSLFLGQLGRNNLPGRGLMVWKKPVDLIMSSAQCEGFNLVKRPSFSEAFDYHADACFI